MKIPLLVLFCVVSQVSGQLIFKYVASRINGLKEIFDDGLTLFMFCLSLSLYGLSVLSWVEALRHMEISRLYMFFALGFILVPLGAHILYHEDFGFYQIAGGVLIVCGIVLANYR